MSARIRPTTSPCADPSFMTNKRAPRLTSPKSGVPRSSAQGGLRVCDCRGDRWFTSWGDQRP